MHSLLIQLHKVFGLVVQKHTRALRLPELEALMPEQNRVVLLLGYIDQEYVVTVDINGLETYQQLFVTDVAVPENRHV